MSAILGGIFAAYLREATNGYRQTGREAPYPIGDFNALKVLDGAAATVDVPNLLALEKALKEVGPDLFTAYKRRVRALGNPTAEAMRKTFKNIATAGPLGAPRRRPARQGGGLRRYDRMATSEVARLSWHNSIILSERKAIDVNYKNRTSQRELNKLKNGRDGTLSIVRVRIHAPAFIVADMAGKTMKAGKATGQYTPYYKKINMSGVTRHRVNSENSQNWIMALDGKAKQRKQSKASRYAWPTMEEQAPKFRDKTSALLEQTINELNRRMTASAANQSVATSASQLSRRVAA